MDDSDELISDAFGLHVCCDTLQSVAAGTTRQEVISKTLYLVLRAMRRGISDVKQKLNRMLSPLNFVDCIVQTVVDCLWLVLASVNYHVVKEVNHLAYISCELLDESDRVFDDVSIVIPIRDRSEPQGPLNLS